MPNTFLFVNYGLLRILAMFEFSKNHVVAPQEHEKTHAMFFHERPAGLHLSLLFFIRVLFG